MQSLLELAPLVAFFIAYKLAGVYTATAVLMGAMAMLLALDYLRTRSIPPVHGLSALLVFVFGAATLLLNDERFIKWKPTIFYWLLSAAFIGSAWIGERPLAQRFLGAALGDQVALGRHQWLRVNWLWTGAFAALGALNLVVAMRFSTATWIGFKIGVIVATFLLMAAQILWLLKRNPAAPDA
jgi:intracellular septation protein